MNAEMLIGIAKPLLKKYSDAPLEDQSKILSELERLAEAYMSKVANGIELNEGEDEILFMLKLQDGQVFLTPCAIDEDDSITRVFVNEYGLNLTQLCRSIPVPKIILLGLALFVDQNEDSQKKALEDIQAIMSDAANLPECKLRVIEEPPLPFTPQLPASEVESENGKVISLNSFSEENQHQESVEKHQKKYDKENEEASSMISDSPKFEIGETALRKAEHDKWVEFTVNEAYLELIADYPEEYKKLDRREEEKNPD